MSVVSKKTFIYYHKSRDCCGIIYGMKMCHIIAATIITAMLCAKAEDARWIWYPGDYGIWWGNRIQSERLQRGAMLTTFWPMYEPHSRVVFSRKVKLDADEPLEIRCDGSAAVYWQDRSGRRSVSAALLGRFTLPRDAVRIEILIYNGARPPSVWVKGPHLVSDSSWSANWISASTAEESVPCDSSARFTDPGTPPGLARLPVTEKKPDWCRHGELGDSRYFVSADFGEETYGYVRFRGIKGSGAVKVIYAESEAERLSVDLAVTEGWGLDGWEMLELSETEEYRVSLPRGFRYVSLVRASGDVTVDDICMDRETKGLPVRGSFRCSDDEINRIWDVSAHTLELTCREVFIEGVKRDHWVWSGDAVQSFLMNYYVFGDYDGCRDTLWALRGKDPVKMHLNSIMDYTFYWFDAVERYRLYSGDRYFARQVYPRMRTLMEFAISRLDKDGRPANQKGDWMFIDWAPKPLPNLGGVASFEQMLLVRALEATAKVAREVGRDEDADSYLARANRLKSEIIPRYWSDSNGGLMHMIYNDGRVDPLITRYPNIFGIFYGYFDEAQRRSVVENVIMNDEVMKIQTPYMRFYELEALCAIGRQADVIREIKSYWGGMLRLGATSFWELYNPDEKGDRQYAMYGRRFGKSLCHAWGASPVYLLGRYCLGVTPTAPGFSEYEVKPDLGGLEWIEGAVPAPFGLIHVKAGRNGVRVYSDGGHGTLILPDGRRVEIPAGKEVFAD